jgi:hypothetical protein
MSAHRYTLQFEVTFTPERIDAKEWQAGLNDRTLRARLRGLLLAGIPLKKGAGTSFDIEFREIKVTE